jgi:hypothetical protein
MTEYPIWIYVSSSNDKTRIYRIDNKEADFSTIPESNLVSYIKDNSFFKCAIGPVQYEELLKQVGFIKHVRKLDEMKKFMISPVVGSIDCYWDRKRLRDKCETLPSESLYIHSQYEPVHSLDRKIAAIVNLGTGGTKTCKSKKYVDDLYTLLDVPSFYIVWRWVHMFRIGLIDIHQTGWDETEKFLISIEEDPISSYAVDGPKYQACQQSLETK